MQIPLENNAPTAVGKIIGRKRYVHVDTLRVAPSANVDGALAEQLAAAEQLASVRRGEHFNLVRIDADAAALVLLHYPGFVGEERGKAAISSRSSSG